MESPRYTSISLLSGEELLGSWYPAAKSAAQCGISDGWGEGLLSPPLSEPLSPASSDYQGSSPFGSDWLDTRVDLLDYLAGPELEGIQHDTAVTPGNFEVIVEDPTARAVQVLQSIAEEQNVLLEQQTKESTSNLPRPKISLIDVSPTSQLDATSCNGSGPLELEATQCDLLDLFPDILDGSAVDAALDPAAFDPAAIDPSSILAPMSPEDIDVILSYPEIAANHGNENPDGESTSDMLTELELRGLEVSVDDTEDPPEVTNEVNLGSELLKELLQQVQAHEPTSPPIVMETPHRTEPTYSPVLSPDSTYYPTSSPEPASSPEWSPEPAATYRSKPYERPRKPGTSRGLPREVIQQERKLRKKQQNKDAATRYRQKKKEEQGVISDELDQLERRNTHLHQTVDTMTNEIKYLKDLLAEVYAAKGLQLPKSAS